MKNTSDELVLVVQGVGHVPAYKNRKRIFRGRITTDPPVQRWMTQVTSSFISQLESLFQTKEGETSTGHWLHSSIAALPADDNWKCLPSMCVSVEIVPKGEEGAVITLEKISPN